MPLCLVVSSMWTWPDRAGDRRVAVVQTEATDEQTLKRLQSEATSNGALVAVWPEFSGLELAPGGNTEQLEKLARESGGGSFVTTFRDGFEPLPHNAAALVSPKGASAEYSKRHLFGGEKNMHTAGDRPIAVEGPFSRVGLEICFDSCYPRAIRETVRLGDVGLVALPTIDPESPHGFIAAVHAAFTPFRAAENGVPIARADGIAHSMIVDGDGRILAELQGGQGVASATISPPVSTLYRKLGDWFLYLSLVGIVAGFFFRKDDQRIDLLTTLPSGLRS